MGRVEANNLRQKVCSETALDQFSAQMCRAKETRETQPGRCSAFVRPRGEDWLLNLQLQFGQCIRVSQPKASRIIKSDSRMRRWPACNMYVALGAMLHGRLAASGIRGQCAAADPIAKGRLPVCSKIDLGTGRNPRSAQQQGLGIINKE
jgi:hypothetical protein